MPRPLFGFALAAALLAAGPCLADPPVPVPRPAATGQPKPAAPAPAAPGLDLPARPPVCVPLPAITS